MLGQHVYIETSTSLEADKMWLMRDYIVDADSDHPYVWVAGDNDKLEKRSVTLGETNEDMGTCEIVDGLKASDYIVWPSEECIQVHQAVLQICQEPRAVTKNL